ncbi:5'-nucleotidase domain-containing protein [Nymphaea thermarum]|nr:5'-nucleotidase domain-containing protein [Nymphaea thermarum]
MAFRRLTSRLEHATRLPGVPVLAMRAVSEIGEGLGFGCCLRKFSGGSPHIEKVLSYGVEDGTINEKIARIREELDAAKRSFLDVPNAIKMMPKMDPKGIYVNRNLRLENIQVYGFDYDYTLAHYSGNLQSLIYDLAKEHLVNELSREAINEIYGTRHIGRDQARGLVGLMDLFCFSEACLIADMVQHFVDAKLEFDACYIYQDVNRAIQHVHQSGLVHQQILSDPQRYLVKNGQVLRFLKMLKNKGKKLFLLTNSPYHFVDGGMSFMLEDTTGSEGSWRQLFDVIIAQANKPSFYTSEHPFRSYDTEKDTLAFSKVDVFLPNQIYYHGNLKAFLQITKWHGPEVIYFGDHLFSDLRGPSKAGWRTAAIIHELENEIRIQNEDSYRCQQAKYHILQELLGKLQACVRNCQKEEAYNALVNELNDERQRARSAMRAMFNRFFGATFVTDTGQESAFAYNIQQYADVYTSKPENFLFYPPEAWLHAPFDIKIMPHHVKVPASLFKA